MSEGEVFAVAGNPVIHSRSPQVMNAAFGALSINAKYTRMLAESGEEAVRTLREIGIGGMNVTSPFKAEVIEHLDSVSEGAEKLGAVNTIVNKGGRLIGHNLDPEGVVGALGARLRGSTSTREPQSLEGEIRGKRAVVIGAGGAGRAALHGLVSAGVEAVVLNRTFSKAQRAAQDLGGRAAPLGNLGAELRDANILVSCVSSSERVVEPSFLREGLIVLDANYGHPSPLVEDAKGAGCEVVDGREWLLFQAVPGFEMFTGKKAPVDVMREALYAEDAGGKRNIALIGFMGSGKSVVSKEIKNLGKMQRVDMDAEVEARAGKPIKQIFAKEGEGKFRKLEKEEVARVADAKATVFACGGGAILDEGNVEVLKKHCVSVWLWAGMEATLERTGGKDSRPLLNVEGREQAARELLAGRKVKYAGAADLLVNTEKRGADEVARMIVDEAREAIRD